ncbi:metal-dependent hydrolase [Bacillus sp. E(2018)]|uniref:metal-dependent hydrolase n=1 Tax=Bacillus sp. E(2018) TaxID=2502239 RepID=UPI0010F8BD4F|nr:metal-dependent hydrolase [Bacillus sp. E(2018)]
MDATSHIIIGLGLGALAQVDPVVSNSSLSYAVVLGTVSGSNAPNADCIFKMKGRGSYFRNHRGWSHSLPSKLILLAYFRQTNKRAIAIISDPARFKHFNLP